MKWLLILAFLTYDEHVGEFIYSAGKPWTVIFDTRAECLKARDEAVNFALKWQHTERDGETSAVSICIKQYYPVAASLPPGMQRPGHGGPAVRPYLGHAAPLPTGPAIPGPACPPPPAYPGDTPRAIESLTPEQIEREYEQRKRTFAQQKRDYPDCFQK
jgi:hypothetical protein